LELITSAAEADLPDAMKKLYDIYTNVSFDFPEAQKWAVRLADWYVQNRGYEDRVTLDAMFTAAQACGLCFKNGQQTITTEAFEAALRKLPAAKKERSMGFSV
jgi:hypothetical protein